MPTPLARVRVHVTTCWGKRRARFVGVFSLAFPRSDRRHTAHRKRPLFFATGIGVGLSGGVRNGAAVDGHRAVNR
jgi:hypothetical protein